MFRPIYTCDRCGHWYTLSAAYESHELPYERGTRFAGKDLCELCAKALRLNEELLTDKHAFEAWMAMRRGAEVKPKRAIERAIRAVEGTALPTTIRSQQPVTPGDEAEGRKGTPGR